MIKVHIISKAIAEVAVSRVNSPFILKCVVGEKTKTDAVFKLQIQTNKGLNQHDISQAAKNTKRDIKRKKIRLTCGTHELPV